MRWFLAICGVVAISAACSQGPLSFVFKPNVQSIASHGLAVNVQLSRAGTAWCTAVTSGIPSVSTLKSAGGLITVPMANCDHVVRINGLTAGTKYRVYCYGEHSTESGCDTSTTIPSTAQTVTTSSLSTGQLAAVGRAAGFQQTQAYGQAPPGASGVYGYSTAFGIGWQSSRIADTRFPEFESHPAAPLADPGAIHLHREEQASRGGTSIDSCANDPQLHSGFFTTNCARAPW